MRVKKVKRITKNVLKGTAISAILLSSVLPVNELIKADDSIQYWEGDENDYIEDDGSVQYWEGDTNSNTGNGAGGATNYGVQPEVVQPEKKVINTDPEAASPDVGESRADRSRLDLSNVVAGSWEQTIKAQISSVLFWKLSDIKTVVATSGSMNADDFKFLAERIPNLVTLDLGTVEFSGNAILNGVNSATSLQSLTLPGGNYSIPDGFAEAHPALKTVNLRGVSNIGVRAFKNIPTMHTVVLPAGIVYSIQREAFMGTNGLIRNYTGITSDTSELELYGVAYIGDDAFLNTSTVGVSTVRFGGPIAPQLSGRALAGVGTATSKSIYPSAWTDSFRVVVDSSSYIGGYPGFAKVEETAKLGSKWVVTLDPALFERAPGTFVVYKNGTEIPYTNFSEGSNKFIIDAMSDDDFATYSFGVNYSIMRGSAGTVSENHNYGAIKVTKRELTMVAPQDSVEAGSAIELSVTSNYPEAMNLEWSSSNTKIATVDSNGKVTGKKKGIVTITVEDKANGFSVSKEITVVEMMLIKSIPDFVNLNDKIILTTDADASASGWSWDEEYFKLDKTKSLSLTAIKAGTGKITFKDSNGVKSSKNVKIRSIVIDKHNKTLDLNKSLSLTITKSHADLKNIHWSTSDNTVVSVDQNGVITANGVGKATITVVDSMYNTTTSTTIDVVNMLQISGIPKDINLGDKIMPTATLKPSTTVGDAGWTYDAKIFKKANDGSLKAIKTGKTTITFTSKDGREESIDVVVRSLTINEHPEYVEVGGELTLKYVKSNTDMTNLNWTSSNPSAVSINNKGKLTVKAAAENVVLTIEDADHYTKATTTIKVVPVLVLNDVPAVIALNGKFTPNASYKALAGETGYKFDKDYIKMNAKGVMTALKAGETTITYKDELGREVSQTIRIRSIGLNEHKEYIEVGATLNLKLSSDDATMTDLTWSSDNKLVATVNKNGKVTAVAPGSVTITVKDNESGVSVSTTLSVVDGLAINGVPEAIALNGTFTPKATQKAVAGETGYTFDKAFIKMNAKGVMTALKAGETTITYKDEYGREVSKTIRIRSIGLRAHESHIELGGTLKLALVSEDPTMTNITWSSDNELVAKVNQNGRVTSLKVGFVTITVTDNDTGVTASTTLEVIGSLFVSNVPSNINVGESFTPEASHIAEAGKTGWTYDKAFFDVDPAINTYTAKKIGTTTFTYTDYLGREVKTDVVIRSLGFEKQPKYIEVGTPFKYTLDKSNVDMVNIVWKSSDTDIATVNANGKVTGLKEGTVTITATDKDFKTTVSANVQIVNPLTLTGIPKNVNLDTKFTPVASHKAADNQTGWTWNDKFFTQNSAGKLVAIKTGKTELVFTDYLGREVKQEIVVRSLSIKKHVAYIEVGAEKKLTLQLDASNKDMKNFTWTSSDEAIATVDANGEVTAIAPGTVTITVQDSDHKTKASTTIDVETKLVLSGIPTNVNVNDTFTPKASHKKADGKKGLVWDSEFFTQDKNKGGEFTALKAGTTTISFTDYLGREVTQEVIVRSLGIKKHVAYVEVGAEKKLALQLETSNADMKNFAWESSDTTIAKVNADGKVTAIAPGTVTITVKDTEHGTVASTTLISETKLELSGIPANVNLDDKFTPKASHKKADGKKGMAWDAKFFTEDKNNDGEFTAIKTGTTTISFTDYLGREVKQEVIVRSLAIKAHPSYVEVGEDTKVQLKLEASNKDMKNFEWTSSDKTIAKVNANGKVTGVKPGIVEITVTDTDHGTVAKTTIDVVAPLTIENIPANVNLGDKFIPKGSHAKPDGKKGLKWDTEYFTQDKNKKGEFTAIKTGETEITFTDYLGRTVKYAITIRDLDILSSKTYVEIGERKDLRLRLKLSHEDMKSFEWKSDNEELAVVDTQGVVTGRSEGTVNISVKDKDHGTTKSIELLVVKPLTLSGIPSRVVVGQTFTVTPSYDKAEKKEAGWKWDASLFNVTFNSPATFTPLKTGVAIITFEDVLGRKISAKFTIYPADGGGSEGGKPSTTPGATGTSAASTSGDGSGGSSKGVGTSDDTNVKLLLSLLLASLGGVGYSYKQKKEKANS